MAKRKINRLGILLILTIFISLGYFLPRMLQSYFSKNNQVGKKPPISGNGGKHITNFPVNPEPDDKGNTEEGSIPSGSPAAEGTIEFLTGKFNYRTHPLFERAPDYLSNRDIYIQKVVLAQFIKMYDAAKEDNVSLVIVSGTRNFEEQKNIWDRKWEIQSRASNDSVKIAQNILTYSSMPSTSRHHWGTDIDINSVSPGYFTTPEGK
ncbi:MAG: D-alanyl-D-alanine carboxypeptidase family protein, partial [Ferruginibacter sp.]|nr:D-alanyl-D-alanine carboxypeptidase family protein [Ferruginibacter sp.]